MIKCDLIFNFLTLAHFTCVLTMTLPSWHTHVHTRTRKASIKRQPYNYSNNLASLYDDNFDTLPSADSEKLP